MSLFIFSVCMPKRARASVCTADAQVIEDIRDNDELDDQLETFENERASIRIDFESQMERIRAEFKTDDPSTLSARQRVRHKTQVEYAEGLQRDRVEALEKKIAACRAAHAEKCFVRKRRRVIDGQIRECATFASLDRHTCDWRLLRKSRHVQTVLDNKVSCMTSEQRAKYASVLEELRAAGWKTSADPT